MNNQGQPGQAAAGQTVPSARQPPMYRPEMMRNLPILNDEEKQKYERGLRQLWNHYETHPEESAQHQDAKKKIQDFTKMLLNKLQQRRMQVQQQQQAQQQAAQQQQQGGQQAQQQQSQPAQPAAPTQQAQPAQQQAPAAAASQANVGGVTIKTEPKTENTTTTTAAEPAHAPTPAPAPAAAAPTPTAPQQAPQATQFPDHILAHIRQMTFNPPQGILDKGQEAAARWSNDFKAKYLRALMQMDQQGIQIRRIDAHVKNQQEKGALGTDEAKQLQIRRDHAQKMHTEAQTFVQNFRKSQEGINKARAAVAAAAAAGQTAASASAAAAQQRPPSQQQQQQNSPAVAASQPPSTQPGGAQASPAPTAQGTPATQNAQNPTTAVNAAIEAAKNQQMTAAAAAGQGTPPQQQQQLPQQHQQQAQQQQQQQLQQQQQQLRQQQIQQQQAQAAAQAAASSAATPTTSQAPQAQQPMASAPQQTMNQGQHHPPPVNTAIASVSAGGGLPSAGTPTQRVATPQSAAPAGPGQALSHSAAVSRANQRNVQTSVPVQQATGTPGSAGAHAQGVMGSGAVPQQQHAHPTQPTQTLQSKLPIPKQLPEKATSVPQPVAMAGGAGAGRPTYTGGGGIAGGVMGQPAISKIPAYVHEAEGDHVLSKKKLDELVRQVCGGNAEGQEINMLTPEVEESVLAMADSFVDNVLETACRNAKERGSKVLEIRDIQLVLERTYNIRVPGYSSDELRTVRKIQPSTAWITKMSAIQAAKVTSGKGE
ncbi:Transcription initiation factor TFIID subunit 12 [Colletotrichum sp. CLE4]